MQSQGDNVADVIYARFSIHAMTEEEETATLFAAASLLKKDGFFISKHDPSKTLRQERVSL